MRLRAALLCLCIVPLAFASGAGHAAVRNFLVVANSFEGDAIAGDGICETEEGNGFCTWAAAQQEVQAGGAHDYLIEFGVALVGTKTFYGSAGSSITIQGPVIVEVDGFRGLRFNGFDGIHVDDVWFLGTGNVIDGFDPAEIAILTDDAPNTCTITNSRFTGLARLFLFTAQHPCDIHDNILGINASGTYAENNAGIVLLGDGASIQRNVIGNTMNVGIDVQGNGHTVKNNFVGVDSEGNPIGNLAGIILHGDLNEVSGNEIASNYGEGLEVRGDENSVYGNVIGTDSAGAAELGNGSNGIFIVGDRNCIGSPMVNFACQSDPLAETGNVIAGNLLDGIRIHSGADNELVFNRVGLAPDGTSLGNEESGIYLADNSTRTRIRGGVISGNKKSGIYLEETDENVIEDVFVGTDPAGLLSRANEDYGIYVFNGNANKIGTGDAVSISNLVSGNFKGGIFIEGSTFDNAEDNEIHGNRIGMDLAGHALANIGHGITLADDVDDTSIKGNIVSGNFASGIRLHSRAEPKGSAPVRTVIQGNYIGTSGPDIPPGPLTAVPNGRDGIEYRDMAVSPPRSLLLNDIGGARVSGEPGIGPGNVIAGNLGDGIDLGYGSKFNTVQGNFIGVDPMMNPLPNKGLAGIDIDAGSPSNTIGGSNGEGMIAGNVISGNAGYGILSRGEKTTIQGNFIGTNQDGTVPTGPLHGKHPLANGIAGISLFAADDSKVGGSTAQGNVIANNLEHGIDLDLVTGVEVSFNEIGLAGSGNRFSGVYVRRGASGNSIYRNEIVANQANGVEVERADTIFNTISQNYFKWNGKKPIELSFLGNEALAAPVADSVSPSQISGTTCSLCIVEVYSSEFALWTRGGETYETSVIANAAGLFVANGPFAWPNLWCTATDIGGNTSEFGCNELADWPYASLFVEKRDVDVNGGTLLAEDLVEYQIDIQNDTTHDFEDVAGVDDLADPIPENASYVPGSLRVDGAPNDDDIADGVGFDEGQNAVIWNGDIDADSGLTVSFRVKVSGSDVEETFIHNQASLVAGAVDFPIASLMSDDPDTPTPEDSTLSVVAVTLPEPGAAAMTAAALSVVVALRYRKRARRDPDRLR